LGEDKGYNKRHIKMMKRKTVANRRTRKMDAANELCVTEMYLLIYQYTHNMENQIYLSK
jgi:hypothetical protein